MEQHQQPMTSRKDPNTKNGAKQQQQPETNQVDNTVVSESIEVSFAPKSAVLRTSTRRSHRGRPPSPEKLFRQQSPATTAATHDPLSTQQQQEKMYSRAVLVRTSRQKRRNRLENPAPDGLQKIMPLSLSISSCSRMEEVIGGVVVESPSEESYESASSLESSTPGRAVFPRSLEPESETEDESETGDAHHVEEEEGAPYHSKGKVSWEPQVVSGWIHEAEINFASRIEKPMVHLSREVQEQRERQPSLLQAKVHNMLGMGTEKERQLDRPKTVDKLRLMILPLSSNNDQNSINNEMLEPRPFLPRDLLDVEQGRAIILQQQRSAKSDKFAVVTAKPLKASSGLPLCAETKQNRKTSNKMRYHPNPPAVISHARAGSNLEVSTLGYVWRRVFQQLLCWTMDEVNALRVSRPLQLNLPFLTGYEAYIAAEVIQALDGGNKQQIARALSVAFQNRNVSRIIVQTVVDRHDFLWHWNTSISWNRWFDAFGQLPVIGFTRFPATENFPSTRDHALASIFRILLGQGNWVTRVVTRGREGIITDDPNTVAQNLTAESNGFELANRNQYGNHFGRIKTNQFRLAHRLPTDESIVRTFITQPQSTMVNNGVVHLLRQVAKHWNNMLEQPFGNFAHQRMEQLDPFETLRFHIPEVLQVLSSLRGRNKWDSIVMSPFIKELQDLKPAPSTKTVRKLARQLKREIVLPVCGGIAAVADPLLSWTKAIYRACTEIEKEAAEIFQLVSSVELGIRVGYDIATEVNWRVPSDQALKDSILSFIRKEGECLVEAKRIEGALHMTTPRDKRTLIELVESNLTETKPAQLLLARVKTLLQRELRRDYLNEAILSLSKGELFHDPEKLQSDEWYWLEGKKVVPGVYVFIGMSENGENYVFHHVNSGSESMVSFHKRKISIRRYIPVAEAITRAQKVFMTIELDYGRTFKYCAFMEFSWLRVPLRRLIVVSQIACEALDNARLNVLAEIQRSKRTEIMPYDLTPGQTYYEYDENTLTYKSFVCRRQYSPSDVHCDGLLSKKLVTMPPQSVLVVGGGPTGLMTTIHCSENCIASGGEMKIYEARDAFEKGGSTFERAQIVRLDARWIATLRYHLGTGFEDVFIPASGETDSQLGNTLPSQGFVEITIKDLESMLHVEVSRLWSRGIIELFTDSRAQYDHKTNSMTKFGEFLKVGDVVYRNIDAEGHASECSQSWKVVELVYTESLSINELRVGQIYGIFVREKHSVQTFVLESVDLESKVYNFSSRVKEADDIVVHEKNLPCVYPSGTQTNAHASAKTIILRSVKKNMRGSHFFQELAVADIRGEKFELQIGHTHVVEAIGKPSDSPVHFLATTTEPYAVCCLQGLKVSMGMHNFGEKRFGSGILDDIRSINDQNTRIISDFTKMVRVKPIIEGMSKTITMDRKWQLHFDTILRGSGGDPDLTVPMIQKACEWLVDKSNGIHRQTLQTRFFETGDNFYLGMEMLREYSRWKKFLVKQLSTEVPCSSEEKARLKQRLADSIDRLWYENCLETIRTGDVYNPGARRRVPRLYLINSDIDVEVGELPVGESFRILGYADQVYEILDKTRSEVIVRTVEGFVFEIEKSTRVFMEGNLTRSPDGNIESKVAISTFPVGHYVNYRTMRMANVENGYVFSFAGDSQSTPHFMRYSGLTGADINCYSFNVFIRKAMEGVPFIERFREYSRETNWSNGEVVQRGTGNNYGQDGFLRPGFSYTSLIDYLYSKVVEYRESGQDPSDILSNDWKNKVAASLVPRGLEMDTDFLLRLKHNFQNAVFEKIVFEASRDAKLQIDCLEELMAARKHEMKLSQEDVCTDAFWDRFFSEFDIETSARRHLENGYACNGKCLNKVCLRVIDFARKAYAYNSRVSSELYNQPKPVDSIVDDFAVEAQNFANSLTLSAAFASAALSFWLVDASLAGLVSSVLGWLNIAIAFGTMTNVSRYKIRNEEARIAFFEEKFSKTKENVFALLDEDARDSISLDLNPYYINLEKKVTHFRDLIRYYDYKDPKEFNKAYDALKGNINNVNEIKRFRKLIACKFIASSYHVNSYVQEALVDVMRVLENMVSLMTAPRDAADDLVDVQILFSSLNTLGPQLEQSLQRGPVRWGFVKQRRFVHWDIVVVFRYFYSLFWFPFCSGSAFSPIQNKIQDALIKARTVSNKRYGTVLRREIRDLENLYWATRESDVASMIFVSTSLNFAAALVFTCARLFSVQVLTSLAFFTTGFAALGAVLAFFHFTRKSRILVGLWFALRSKSRRAHATQKSSVIQIEVVTATQLFLTIARLGASGAAAVALPFAVAENGFGDSISTSPNLPFWIAFGALMTAVLSTVLFLIVEYVVRYNLTTHLGPFVCELFREEIENTYNLVKIQLNNMDSLERQFRENWEYTARDFLHEYRFDTVFAADRFGQILQYIQAGMDPRTTFV